MSIRMIPVAMLLALLSLVLPASAQDAINLTESCVAEGEYDPEVDYFPAKLEVEDAAGFSVEYSNNYKVVTVQGSMATFEYVLVQCGTPAPDDAEVSEDAQVINVPADSIVTLSTTQVIHLIELGLLDQLVGMDSFLYINAPQAVERIEAEDIIEVAPNFELNIETLLDLEPSLIMSDDSNPDRLALLADNDITAVVNTEYLETSPLGQAEWLKYTSLFFNAEATATEVYDEIVSDYETVAELAAEIAADERPVVLWNAISPFSDSWGIPGVETIPGQLIEDAGGIVALGDEADPQGVAYLSLETVYEGALDADIWLTNLFNVTDIEGLLAIDERYADFAAFENGQVYNNDADVNANGGNNYYELGVTNPHLILEDLIAIFHPELLPEHEFNFFRPLE